MEIVQVPPYSCSPVSETKSGAEHLRSWRGEGCGDGLRHPSALPMLARRVGVGRIAGAELRMDAGLVNRDKPDAFK